MRRALGLFMIALPFLAVLVATIKSGAWRGVGLVFGTAVLVAALFYFGIQLLYSK